MPIKGWWKGKKTDFGEITKLINMECSNHLVDRVNRCRRGDPLPGVYPGLQPNHRLDPLLVIFANLWYTELDTSEDLILNIAAFECHKTVSTVVWIEDYEKVLIKDDESYDDVSDLIDDHFQCVPKYRHTAMCIKSKMGASICSF